MGECAKKQAPRGFAHKVKPEAPCAEDRCGVAEVLGDTQRPGLCSQGQMRHQLQTHHTLTGAFILAPKEIKRSAIICILTKVYW